MWVRGLKPARASARTEDGVAPHVGAWIETNLIGMSSDGGAVAPHVGAWIETAYIIESLYVDDVAPHVGAWIETMWELSQKSKHKVAPHVGAWIETNIEHQDIEFVKSHPMWVRGLKHFCKQSFFAKT